MLALIKAWLSANVFRVNPYHDKFVILRFIDLYYKGGRDTWFGLTLDTGNNDEYPGNKLVVQLWKYSAWIKIPKILEPWAEKHTFTSLSPKAEAQRIAEYGHLNYFEYHTRRFGFHIESHGIHLNYGPSTWDSQTTKARYISFPWTNLDLVFSAVCDADGSEHKDVSKDGRLDYKQLSAIKDQMPRYVFLLRDYDGQEIRAYCHIEKRVYRVGTGWIKKYFGWLRPVRTFVSLDIAFDGETGPEKGSWKGGTIGTGVKADKSDKIDAQFLIEKYCSVDHHSKGGRYSMELIGREPNAPYTNETYRKAIAERKGEVYEPLKDRAPDAAANTQA